jgi:hypothetical protein
MLLALALYVYDAALLLASNEFVAVRTGASRWRCKFGANNWKLGGREPWVPNLLMPWRDAVRVRWSIEDGLQPSDGLHVPAEQTQQCSPRQQRVGGQERARPCS